MVLKLSFTEEDVQEIIERYEIEDVSQALLPSAEGLIIKFWESLCYDGEYEELFIKDGRLYENSAWHCSCSGCEGQWKPEETLLSAIKRRPDGFGRLSYEEVEALARAAGYLGY